MDADYRQAIQELSAVDYTQYFPASRISSGSHNVAGPSMDSKGPYSNHRSASTLGIDVDLNKHPSGVVPELQNVVATCSLGCELDLKRIAQHARNAEYNPKRFAAVIMRIREPKTTALIFSSGKMVCTGARNEADSRLASRKYAKIVMKLGYRVTFQDFKIQNIVGSCGVDFAISLEGLHIKHNLFSRYEPELFPGLIYKMKSPRVVLLVFLTGKVVLTGAKTREQIYEAFEKIYPALTEFRKGKRKASDSVELSNVKFVPSIDASSSINGSLPNHKKPDTNIGLSPFLSSRSISLQSSMKEDSKIMQPAISTSIDPPSSGFPDLFYSRLSPPYGYQASISGELQIGQVSPASRP